MRWARSWAIKTVKADGAGHDQAIRWVQSEFAEKVAADPEGLRWGIEDCRHLSARLEIAICSTAGQSGGAGAAQADGPDPVLARTLGKSDPIDALAVARAVLREPDLPVAPHDEASRELKLLVDRREDLVKERTAMMNRFRWHLHRIDPTVDPAPKSLKQTKTRRELTELLADLTGIDARLAREVLADIDRITPVINVLETGKSPPWSTTQAASTAQGCPAAGALTAAKLVGETAGIDRFRPRGQVRHARRRGPDPGLVGPQRRAGPDVQGRKQTTQYRPAPHCDHPATTPRTPSHLLREATGRRRLKDRSAALPQTPACPCRVQHP